jgi:hypothetical protein
MLYLNIFKTWFIGCTAHNAMGSVTAFLLAATAATAYAAEIPNGDVHELVQRSAAKIVSDWNEAPNYSFVERDVVSKHDGPASVKVFEVVMLDGSPYERLIAIDDRPLSAAEQASEAHKVRSELRKRERESEDSRTKRVSKYVKERHENGALLKAMVDAFAFSLVGSESVNNHDCWVLDAAPKPGYQPTSRETKVLAGMRGRMWVDKASGQWVRVQAEVFQTVNFYGFFAKVRPGTKFMLEQEQVADNLWLPKHFKTQVSASVLGFFNQDSEEDDTYTNYRPMSQALSQLGTR